MNAEFRRRKGWRSSHSSLIIPHFPNRLPAFRAAIFAGAEVVATFRTESRARTSQASERAAHDPQRSTTQEEEGQPKRNTDFRIAACV